MEFKRKFYLDQSSKEKTKKFRDDDGTSIENFSNEIFYEIFDYLDGCEIYQAFANLNHRFDQLLLSSSLLLKIKLHPSTPREFLAFHRHNIFSVHLSTFNHENQLISSFNIDLSFIHLESLVLDSIEPEILHSFISKLIDLPRLFLLTIKTWYTGKNFINIYQLIFQLRKLRYLKLSALKSSDSNITVPLLIPSNHQSNSIEHLVIDHPCTLKEFSTIISHTSQLRRLNFTLTINKVFNVGILSSMTLSNLTCIYMQMPNITFNKLEIFISKLQLKLKLFSFTSLSQDVNYLDAHRWEEFILKYLQNLEKFYLNYSERYNKHYEARFFDGNNQFLSPFWTERQWIYEANVCCNQIIYSIRPYQGRWYDRDVQHSVMDSSIRFPRSSRMILTAPPSAECFFYLKRNLFHIISVARIYHLEMSGEIFFDHFFEILLTLLCLHSFIISSLSLSFSNVRAEIGEKVRDFFVNTNRIAKVHMKKINTIEEVYALMKLCPRMMYLKIDCKNDLDMEFFLRNILKIIQEESNEYLRLLSFHLSAADDQMVQRLDKMINTEKLLFNYTIKRIVEDIYIQWK